MTNRRSRWLLLAAALSAAGAAGYSALREAPAAPATPPTYTDVAAGLQVIEVAQGLDHPWSLAFLPDGMLLVTERVGRLRTIDARGVLSAPIAGVPAVDARGQGGLFDVHLDPAFASNRRLFLSWAALDGAHANGLAVASATLSRDNRALRDLKIIFRQQPAAISTGHFGGRLVIGSDGNLFVTLGDRQTREERGKAQHLDKHHGKIVRIRVDGSIPADNPFLKTAGARPETWSLGHRNVQGAALHPQTGELWASEHGPQGGDEINVVKRGRNYGWPVITYGCEYGTCRKLGEGTAKTGMEQPLTYWVPKSTAPSGLAFYTGDRYPGWKGNLFSGSLAGRTLWRLELDGERVVARHALLTGMNERLRDVRQGPDGYLYLLTDSERGRVLRVEPLPAKD
ncbi:MAG: PQQ-dependent sugar dehydrogenase [Gammaproteobacteria bacterium]